MENNNTNNLGNNSGGDELNLKIEDHKHDRQMTNRKFVVYCISVAALMVSTAFGWSECNTSIVAITLGLFAANVAQKFS